MLSQLRNAAIHTYLYITQDIALAAVGLAEANLADFEQRWADPAGPVPPIPREKVRPLDWDELVKVCNLDFLPLTRR